MQPVVFVYFTLEKRLSLRERNGKRNIHVKQSKIHICDSDASITINFYHIQICWIRKNLYLSRRFLDVFTFLSLTFAAQDNPIRIVQISLSSTKSKLTSFNFYNDQWQLFVKPRACAYVCVCNGECS